MKYGMSNIEFKDHIKKWHRAFALWPKEITIGKESGRKIWLEHYEWKYWSDLQYCYYVREVK